jgi:hypothetical protein
MRKSIIAVITALCAVAHVALPAKAVESAMTDKFFNDFGGMLMDQQLCHSWEIDEKKV